MAEIQEQLTSYLTDAHSIEEQALSQLRQAPSIAQVEGLSAAFRDHLAETEGHERAVARLLEQRDASPSWFKDAVMRLGGKGFIFFAKVNPDTPGKLLAHALSYEALEEASYRLLALVAEQGEDAEVVATAKRIGDEEVAMQRRLETQFDAAVAASLAAFSYAFEHLEIGGYEQLERVAGRAGDDETVAVARTILEQERDAAAMLKAAFPEAARLALGARAAR